MSLDLRDIALILDAGAQKAAEIGASDLADVLTEMADTAVLLREQQGRTQHSWYAGLRERNGF